MLLDAIRQIILKDMGWSPEWDDNYDDDYDNNSSTTTYVKLTNSNPFSFRVAFDNTNSEDESRNMDTEEVNLDNDINEDGDIVYY